MLDSLVEYIDARHDLIGVKCGGSFNMNVRINYLVRISGFIYLINLCIYLFIFALPPIGFILGLLT